MNTESENTEYEQIFDKDEPKNKSIDISLRFTRPSVDPSCYDVEEIFVRAGLFNPTDFLTGEAGSSKLETISIPPAWMTAPALKKKGMPNHLAALILAEIVTDRLRLALKSHDLKAALDFIDEHEEDMGPKVYSWHYEAWCDETQVLEEWFETSLGTLAQKYGVSRAEVGKAIKVLEFGQLITATYIQRLEDGDDSYHVTKTSVQNAVRPDLEFRVDVVTPSLAEITLPDLLSTSDETSFKFRYKLLRGQWMRDRGDGLRLWDALCSLEFKDLVDV
jgi:hypothetical protein